MHTFSQDVVVQLKMTEFMCDCEALSPDMVLRVNTNHRNIVFVEDHSGQFFIQGGVLNFYSPPFGYAVNFDGPSLHAFIAQQRLCGTFTVFN
ncbi:hypothetical protein HY17_16675 [Hyphomonas sp. CY54-11-8]|nr:hypothetical protein HY17_16675 [Hyphomonas sp. CY54-11-8]